MTVAELREALEMMPGHWPVHVAVRADGSGGGADEDWMNDMATQGSRMPRGWQAQYQTRCDCCGRFVRPGQPGSSWVMVPETDWNRGDERERCPACTEKHGPATCGPQYVAHLCCGVVPNAEVSR